MFRIVCMPLVICRSCCSPRSRFTTFSNNIALCAPERYSYEAAGDGMTGEEREE